MVDISCNSFKIVKCNSQLLLSGLRSEDIGISYAPTYDIHTFGSAIKFMTGRISIILLCSDFLLNH
jgi:hypothetical protein